MKRALFLLIALTGSTSTIAQPAPQGAEALMERGFSELTTRFAAADTNHDRFLSRKEAETNMSRIYIHFDKIDANHDGRVSMDEITSRMGSMAEKAQQFNPSTRFADADVNHDNIVSRKEAEAKMPRLYLHFDAVDTNHDGGMSMDEMTAHMRSMGEKAKSLKPMMEGAGMGQKP